MQTRSIAKLATDEKTQYYCVFFMPKQFCHIKLRDVVVALPYTLINLIIE